MYDPEYYYDNIDRLVEIEKKEVYIEGDKGILYTVIENNDIETLDYLVSRGMEKIHRHVFLIQKYRNCMYSLQNSLLSIPNVTCETLKFITRTYGVDFSIMDLYRYSHYVERMEILKFIYEYIRFGKDNYMEFSIDDSYTRDKFTMLDYALYKNCGWDIIQYLEGIGIKYMKYENSSPLEDPAPKVLGGGNKRIRYSYVY